MNNITFKENELKFPTKKIRFKQQIRTIEFVDNVVVVLLEIPYEDNKTINNLCAFNVLGERIWKVQPLSERFPDFETYLPYENLFYKNGKLAVSDFMGRTFFIDAKSGNLLDMQVFK